MPLVGLAEIAGIAAAQRVTRAVFVHDVVADRPLGVFAMELSVDQS